MFRQYVIPTILFDDPADGGAGSGAPAGPGSASPGTSAIPSTGAPAGGAPASTGAPAAAKAFSYAEDRSDWMPRHRYNEATGRAKEHEQRAENYRRMLEAGTGVKVPGYQPPQDPAIVEARALLFDQLAPELKPLLKLTPEQIDKIISTVDEFPKFAQSQAERTQQEWNGRGEQAINHICGLVAKEIGTETLTPFQQMTVGNGFIAWLQMGDGSRLGRYGQGDGRLFDEFMGEYRSGFFDPVRRTGQASAAAGAARNSRLPNAPTRSGVVPGTRTPQPPKTEDDVHEAAWKSFAAAQGQ